MNQRRVNNDPLADIVLEDVDFTRSLDDRELRVQRLALEQLRPDPHQPRRVLPADIHHKYHAQVYSAAQAMRAFVGVARESARAQGMPFDHVRDLLDTQEDAPKERPALTGSVATLSDLVSLAVTMQDDGLVNPLTVIDKSAGTVPLYRIETGERRYWAGWLLREYIVGPNEAVTLLCRIIPTDKASIFRQARENTARADLNAIGLMRQTALLLFAVHGVTLPGGPLDNDFYRQALDLDLRGKREHTEAVLAAMGGIQRAQFSRIKKLLRLSDRAIAYADEHDLPLYVLRVLADLAVADQDEYIRYAEEMRWTPQQLLQQLTTGPEDEDHKMATAAVRAIRRDFRRDTDVRAVAQQLLEAEHNDSARAVGHLRSKINWFNEILQVIEEL